MPVDEIVLRMPDVRMARTREILALQEYVLQEDGSFLGKHFRAKIDVDRPTQESAGFGARPSYVICYGPK